MLFPLSTLIVFISQFYSVMRLMPFTFRFQPLPTGNTKYTHISRTFLLFFLVCHRRAAFSLDSAHFAPNELRVYVCIEICLECR